MKATTIKSILVKLALLLAVTSASAQDLIGTRIDVQGARFSDQMWIFSVATCTNSYDNGWDGYKMFGTTVAPQIFAFESDGNYQVDARPDANNTYIGFSAGVDTAYTFTFTHQNLSVRYQKLYLVDSVANKVVDIYADGSTYTFTAQQTAAPVKRFKIVTSMPQTASVPTTPTTTTVSTTVPVITPSTTNTSSDTAVTPAASTTTKTMGGESMKNSKQLNIYSAHNTVYIENKGKQKGKMMLYNAMSGKLIKKVDFNANGITTIETAELPGTYVVYGATAAEEISKTLVLR